jgi:predicted porin
VTQPKSSVVDGKIKPTNVYNQFSSNTSWVGVRGSHDLGGGLKGVYQVETQADLVNTPNGSSGLLGYLNSYVGLAGA